MEAAKRDPEYQFLWQQVREAKKQGKKLDYGINDKQILLFRGIICIPN